MKRYGIYLAAALVVSSCSDFLRLQPEHQVNENSFYKTAADFETALVGSYAGLQELHNAAILYAGELTTDNTEIRWTSPTVAETELDEMNPTAANSFIGSIWTSCFATISRSNNILSRLGEVRLTDTQLNQIKGEALFLRAYSYFYLVRLFGDLPLVTTAFRSPNEIASFDMSRKPVADVYKLITSDLGEAARLLEGITAGSKSRASSGAAKTLLGKVFLTQGDPARAAAILEEVIHSGAYALQPAYASLFTNGNNELKESVFEIKYLSGNVGEGNQFSTLFTPARFDMAIFPGNMQGAGRILPTREMAASYEPGDLRRAASIGDSVRLNTGKYEKELYGLKFVDFTVGVVGDGGINYTSLRYADVLLTYAEALNETGNTTGALPYLNQVRKRAGLPALSGLSQEDFREAMEHERKVEFFLEGHRWFDLVRTKRFQTVMNRYFSGNGLAFRVDDHEWVMPVPLRELDIDPKLKQNDGY